MDLIEVFGAFEANLFTTTRGGMARSGGGIAGCSKSEACCVAEIGTWA